MAKVTAPIKISGTLDDLNFVITSDGNNYVRMKGKTGITAEAFRNNPIFNPIREQGKEWGYCSVKSKSFRQLVPLFFNQAKDGSFAGRTIKLVSEILQEDRAKPKGYKKLETAYHSEAVPELVTGFEGNRTRPLAKTLRTDYSYDPHSSNFTLPDFCPETKIDWPEAHATHLTIQLATAVWNPENETVETLYSPEVNIAKYEREKQTVTLTAPTLECDLWKMVFLFIGFTVKSGNTFKMLHRKHNTTTLIACYK